MNMATKIGAATKQGKHKHTYTSIKPTDSSFFEDTGKHIFYAPVSSFSMNAFCSILITSPGVYNLYKTIYMEVIQEIIT